jgi:hypothetical protein
MIFCKENSKKITEIDKKRLRKKVALIKTDYDCSQPQLTTPTGSTPLLIASGGME